MNNRRKMNKRRKTAEAATEGQGGRQYGNDLRGITRVMRRHVIDVMGDQKRRASTSADQSWAGFIPLVEIHQCISLSPHCKGTLNKIKRWERKGDSIGRIKVITATNSGHFSLCWLNKIDFLCDGYVDLQTSHLFLLPLERIVIGWERLLVIMVV